MNTNSIAEKLLESFFSANYPVLGIVGYHKMSTCPLHYMYKDLHEFIHTWKGNLFVLSGEVDFYLLSATDYTNNHNPFLVGNFSDSEKVEQLSDLLDETDVFLCIKRSDKITFHLWDDAEYLNTSEFEGCSFEAFDMLDFSPTKDTLHLIWRPFSPVIIAQQKSV